MHVHGAVMDEEMGACRKPVMLLSCVIIMCASVCWYGSELPSVLNDCGGACGQVGSGSRKMMGFCFVSREGLLILLNIYNNNKNNHIYIAR